jgi:hypothetical protein
VRAQRNFVVAALMLVALGGCKGGGSGPAPTPPPTTPATPTVPAATSLARLASAGAALTFRASYTVRERHPRSEATWSVWRAPHALRVDVITGRARATLIVTPAASYACHAAGHRRRCFRVARHGRPIPAPFRLLAQDLFSGDLLALAQHAGSYDVTNEPVSMGGGALQASACFAVRGGSGGTPVITRATYCFSSDGVLTTVRYPSGSSVELASVTLQQPPAADFRPYAHPTPLA